MDLSLYRIYLLAGLLAHKLLWEFLKRGEPAKPKVHTPLPAQFVKVVKIGILLAIVAQTLLPEILPITPDPSILRPVGLALYTAGLALAMWSRLLLGNNWSDIETAGVKRKQEVVARGIYRYIRHPIYVGDLILLLGLELALNSWLVAGMIVLTPVVLRQAISEEKMLLATLPGYDRYARETKRFVPFIA